MRQSCTFRANGIRARSESRPSVVRGSALDTTVRARIRDPSSRHDRFARDDLGNPRVAQDDRAGLLRRAGQRERHVAHAAVDVPPGARPSLDGAHGVHRVDRGGPRIARPAHVPISPWPCSAVRSRSSRTWRSMTEAIDSSNTPRSSSRSWRRSSSSAGRSGASPTQVSCGSERSACRMRAKSCSYRLYPSASPGLIAATTRWLRSGSSHRLSAVPSSNGHQRCGSTRCTR